MWVIYLIQHTTTKEIYLGITQNLQRRICEHNANSKKFTTRLNNEWILIYAKTYRCKEDAFERERKLKYHNNAKQKLVKRLKFSLLA